MAFWGRSLVNGIFLEDEIILSYRILHVIGIIASWAGSWKLR